MEVAPDDTTRMARTLYQGMDAAREARALSWDAEFLTFGTFPIQEDKVLVVPFYEPGTNAIRQVAHTITGSESIEGYQGQKIDCWVMKNKSQTFWISKQTGELLRIKEQFAPGRSRYLVRLAYAEQ